MASLVAGVNRRSSYPGQGFRANLFTDNNDTYYAGAIVVWNVDGDIKVASDVNGETVAGIVMETTVLTGRSGYVPVLCRSRVWFPTTNVFADISSLGALFSASTDNDLLSARANKTNVGRCIGVKLVENEVLLDMSWVT